MRTADIIDAAAAAPAELDPHIASLVRRGTAADTLAEPTAESRVAAFGYWLEAADAGHAPAQYRVGQAYLEGSGCAPNVATAARWFRAAALQGHAEAEASLESLQASGEVPINDNPAAIELYVGGHGHDFLREGWGSLGIADTWTVGPRAEANLPLPDAAQDWLLTLRVEGIFPPWGTGFQRIRPFVGGVGIGEIVCRGPASFEFYVPAAVIRGGGTVDVALELPDARRPVDCASSGDLRFLALRLSLLELRALDPAELAAREADTAQLGARAALLEMESLGMNCEFGFLQRSVGAEPMGLFRWTLAPLAKLIPAIEAGFAGLLAPGAIRVDVATDGEYVTEDTVYGFQHHSFFFASTGGTPELARRSEYLRVGMLTQGLREALRRHNKLFVYHDGEESTLEDLRRLVGALHRHGPNWLLWLVTAPRAGLVGQASCLEPGLIQGYVSGFDVPLAAEAATTVHRASWLAACVAAHRLWREFTRTVR
jgi:hypothetical protein